MSKRTKQKSNEPHKFEAPKHTNKIKMVISKIQKRTSYS